MAANLSLNPHQRRVDAGIAELFLGGVGIFLLLERTDADAVHRASALLALGQPALHPEHRQPGALLLGILGAGERAGLDVVGERVAACGQGLRCRGDGALAATVVGVLAAEAAARAGLAALAPGSGGSTAGVAGTAALGGNVPGGRPAPTPGSVPGSCRPGGCSDPSCDCARPRRLPGRAAGPEPC
jgi:hypothetical protein